MMAESLECGIAPLSESDNLLLYLVILALYKEGVRPTYSEVHYKLKEYHSSWDVERSFLVYYLLQPQRYVLKYGTTILESNANVARQLLAQHSSRSRSRKPHTSAQAIKPFQATDVLIYFREEPAWFQGWVNLKDGRNRYSLRLWSVLISFFRLCTSNSSPLALTSIFKQTRYSLAKSLKAIGPPEIREMRLGEIAHMAQLAIQHGFLCYEANTIQPTWTSYTLAAMKSFHLNLKVQETDSPEARLLIEQYTSTSRSKEGQLSQANSALASVLKGTGTKEAIDDEDKSTTVGGSTFKSSPRNDLPPLTDVHELRAAVKKLLSLEDCGQILLSQLRVILQSKMHINLVPWTLGYAKLSNLLIAECSDVCRLVRHGGRHVFVEACPSDSSHKSGGEGNGCASSLDKLEKMDHNCCCSNHQVNAENSKGTVSNDVYLEVSRFVNLSSRIQSCVPLYLLNYSPEVLDFVMSGGMILRQNVKDRANWDYSNVQAICGRLNGCRLSVLFHGLPFQLPSQGSESVSCFDDLLAINWSQDHDPPAQLLSSLIGI